MKEKKTLRRKINAIEPRVPAVSKTTTTITDKQKQKENKIPLTENR